MNLSIKGKFTTISKPTLPKIKPAARVMKPERQAAVDSIPPVYLLSFFVTGNDKTET